MENQRRRKIQMLKLQFGTNNSIHQPSPFPFPQKVSNAVSAYYKFLTVCHDSPSIVQAQQLIL